MTGIKTMGLAASFCAVTILAGCEDGTGMNPFQSRENAETPAASGPVELVEQDVEAPEVFSVAETGLWDGRPSLGGIWVAHPDVQEPERVVIRNQTNGNSTIGALFRRERNNPGPSIQVSSDAARELGLLAGQPTELSVIALRREAIPVEPTPAAVADVGIEGPSEVEEATLDPIASAAAAIEAAEAAAPTEAAPTAAPVVDVAAAAPATVEEETSEAEGPFVQVGLFSVQENAQNTASTISQMGVVPTVRETQSGGETVWSVLVGPTGSRAEGASLLRRIKDQGFEDAYLVIR